MFVHSLRAQLIDAHAQASKQSAFTSLMTERNDNVGACATQSLPCCLHHPSSNHCSCKTVSVSRVSKSEVTIAMCCGFENEEELNKRDLLTSRVPETSLAPARNASSAQTQLMDLPKWLVKNAADHTDSEQEDNGNAAWMCWTNVCCECGGPARACGVLVHVC